MTILLVRHARAGRRERWKGEDRLRPLSAKGRVQADALPPILTPWTAATPIVVLSSPWVRCVQTLEPLGGSLDVSVVEEEALGEGMAQKAVGLLPGWLGGGTTILCTHGDVIEGVLGYLADRSVDLGPKPNAAKGSVWVIEGTRNQIREARYLPPPA